MTSTIRTVINKKQQHKQRSQEYNPRKQQRHIHPRQADTDKTRKKDSTTKKETQTTQQTNHKQIS